MTDDLKRQLYRWWMEGKDLRLKPFGDESDTAVLVEFQAIAKTVIIPKESGETVDEALRRYFADFKKWKAQEAEVELGEMRIGLVVRELVSELSWEFHQLRKKFINIKLGIPPWC